MARRRPSPHNQWDWHWRSAAAMIYLLICFFDFLAMPVYREYTNARLPVDKMVELAMKMDGGATQIEALKILRDNRAWTPVTNDVFHLAFGAILGVSALPMNRRRRFPGSGGDDDDDGSGGYNPNPNPGYNPPFNPNAGYPIYAQQPLAPPSATTVNISTPTTGDVIPPPIGAIPAPEPLPPTGFENK